MLYVVAAAEGYCNVSGGTAALCVVDDGMKRVPINETERGE